MKIKKRKFWKNLYEKNLKIDQKKNLKNKKTLKKLKKVEKHEDLVKWLG